MGGWGNTTTNSLGTDPRNEANALHPLLQQGVNAMESAYPGYTAGLLNNIHQYGTANGQWGLVGNQRGGDMAAATQAGNTGAFQAALGGGGQTLQNATRLASAQQGQAAGNAFQSQLASPGGQQAANGLVSQDMNALGAGSPANQLWQQLFSDEMQRRQINNTAPQSGGFFGSLLGAIAPFTGMIGGGGHPAAAPAPQAQGGGYGTSLDPGNGGYVNPFTPYQGNGMPGTVFGGYQGGGVFS